MSRVVQGVLFFGIFFGIFGGLHYYVWARLVRDTAPPSAWSRWATAAIILLGTSIPLSFLSFRVLSMRAAKLIAWPAYIWMGLLAFLFMVLLGLEAVRGIVLVAGKVTGQPLDAERRAALGRMIGAAAATVASGLGLVSMREALRRVELREVEVALPRLPRALDGLSIVQLTDIHVGPTIGRAFIEGLVARTNALEPDVVAITGDLVDGSVEQLRDQVAPLSGLQAKLGVFFVTGNHEYYSGADEWIAELRRLGVTVLRNERVTLSRDGAQIDLAGVDDHNARGLPGHGADVPRAVAGREPQRPLVLLAHQPREVIEAARHGVDLQLSGHTHGGQIWPWGWLVKLQQPYVAGLVQHGGTQLYVSRGTGYWGPPMRLHAPAELTRIVLRSRA